MGQVATQSVNNLGYFSRAAPISTPLSQPPQQTSGFFFNRSKTYVAHVVGDGDNVAFLQTSRRAWMQQRVEYCSNGSGCFPLVWTISPHTVYLAPGWLLWFFAQAQQTQHDYFCLPPSGHLYVLFFLAPIAHQFHLIIAG